MFNYSTLPLESQMKKTPWPNITVVDVMCAAVLVYKDQGFVRSGQGYTDTDTQSGEPIEIQDNKTCIVDILEDPEMSFSEEEITHANNLMDTINGKLMIKKMTNNLNNFEQNVAKALSDPQVNNFAVSIIASLPHSVEIDKKPGLLQIIGPDGEPKRFQAKGKDCKIMKVITTDSKGEETTMHRLDIPEEESF